MSRKGREVFDPDKLPNYASRSRWAEALDISYSCVQQATDSGLLEGDRHGNSWHHSKKQILKWYAPSLYSELYEVTIAA